MGVKLKWHREAWWIFVNDKKRRTSQRVGTDKAAAQAVARQVTISLKAGQFSIKPKAERVTLAEFGRRMLAVPLRRKEFTTTQYLQTAERHIFPALGTKEVTEITRDDVFRFADGLRKPLAHGSVRYTVSILRLILNDAVTQGLIQANPAARLGRAFSRAGRSKEEVVSRVRVLTRELVVDLLDAILAAHGSTMHAFFLCLARTGMRIGEGIALEWGSVEFDNRRIRIYRTMSNGRFGPPKSGKERYVDMSEQLALALKRLRQFAGDYNDKTLVFRTPTGTRQHYRRLLDRWDDVTRTMKEIDGRVTPHILRHTFASQLLANGESPAYVSEQLGHSSLSITLDIYGHFIPTKGRAAVNTLDDATTHPRRILREVAGGKNRAKRMQVRPLRARAASAGK